MSLHTLVLFVLVSGFVLAVLGGAGRRAGVVGWPVYAKPVMSEAEREFYSRLRTAVPEFSVLCQVQICRFVEVRRVAHWRQVWNRYNLLSADFLLCSTDFRPLLAIELDDASHDRSAQRARDAKKDSVLAAAGVPILRFRGQVPVDRLRESVLKALRRFDQVAGGVQDIAGAGRKLPYVGTL